MKATPVRDLMHTNFVTVNEDTTLAELVELLAENKVRSVPVVDAAGKLLGVASETDLFIKERSLPFSMSMDKVPTLLGRIIDERDLENLDEAKQVPVKDIMCKKVATASPETTLQEAAMHMLHRSVTMLPVLEDDELVGIVRRVDILGAIFGEHAVEQD